MDAATSPAVTTPPPSVAFDDDPLLVDAELVVADISDRALRLALLLGWHDREDDWPPDAELAQSLRCAVDDVRVAWAELAAHAPRGALDCMVFPRRHQCSEGDW